jgi:hypothetical protein
MGLYLLCIVVELVLGGEGGGAELGCVLGELGLG